MNRRVRGGVCCARLTLVALVGIILPLALAPAWAGSTRSGRNRSKPVVEASEQDTSLPDLVNDPRPLTGKGGVKPVADAAPLPAASRAAAGWSAQDLGGTPAAAPAALRAHASVLDIGGKLLAVVLCVYGLFTGLRLFKAGQFTWPRLPRADAPEVQLRLIETLPLGGNRRVYLVQAGGRALLIGADASGMAALGEVPAASAGPGDAVSANDTNEITPALTRRAETRAELASPLRPLGGHLQTPAALGGAQKQRDEEDWARKRDLLIRALKEKAVG